MSTLYHFSCNSILQSIWRSSILQSCCLNWPRIKAEMNARTMKNSTSSYPCFIQAASFIFFFLFSLLQPPAVVSAQRGLITAAAAAPAPAPEPDGLDRTDAATNARSLVAQNNWGVLSTISVELGGAPFGNVVSFSDGFPGRGYGVPYFYLEELEPKGRYEINGTKATFTVSEDPLGTCRTDTQNPKCMRTTLTGKLAWISLRDPELKLAQLALYTKHPEMQGWFRNQNFQIYKLDLEDIFLVNEVGRPQQLTPKDYLKVGPL